ncbi:MAG: SapC family protein [Pseudomonadota bacterium]
MFNNPVSLNPETHRHLRYDGNQSYGFAADLMLTPVVSGEIKQVAREYVIVFSTGEKPLPQALLGTERGINAYVGDNPKWWARYVPAHLRRYPFILSAPSSAKDGEQRFTVMFDDDAPHLGEIDGEPLFDQDGGPTPVLESIQHALSTLQTDFERTAKLVRQLEEHGLLVDQPIKVTPPSGEPRGLKGFRVVDEEKLNSLGGDSLKTLYNSGALKLVFAHLISLSNLRDGVLAKKPGRQPGGGETPDLESLFGGDDDFSFDFDS